MFVFLAWITMTLHFVLVDASSIEEPDSKASDAEAAALRIEAADAKARASIEASKKSEEKFKQTFQSMQAQLDSWKAAIAAAGADADPALVERAEALEKDLKEVGVEYMKTVGTEDLDGSGQFAAQNDQDTYGPFYGCLSLSVKSLGQNRASTQKALRMLIDMGGVFSASALAKEELWRRVSICVGSLTTEEYSDFKAGKLQTLPAAYVDGASTPEAEKKVLELSAPVWTVIQTIAKQMYQAQGEQAAAPPFAAGMLALIPVGLGIAFLLNIFRDMKKKEDAKKAKKEKKDSKKAN